MRDIKFRGKYVVSGEWVYGDLIVNSIIDPFTYVSAGIGLKVDDPAIGKPIKVLPNTVGQYTGLKDKDGREIWEGDIYTVNSFNYQICFVNGAFTGGINNISSCPMGWDSEYKSEDLFESNFANTVTVIGNIHDNPELLK